MSAVAVTYTRLLMGTRTLLARYLPGRGPAWMPVRAVSRFLRDHIIPNQAAWVQVQDGFAKGVWLQLNLSTERNWWSGKHEVSIQIALEQFLSAQNVMYDVGAHMGFHALPAARSGAQVVAFEADPENAARLRANVNRNRVTDKVRIVEAAVWSNSGTQIPFRRGLPRSQGGVCWSDHQPVLASGEIIHVRRLALDEFVLTGGPPPDIIKIDVEGGASEVLNGAGGILETRRPALIIEVHTPFEYLAVSKVLNLFCYVAHWEMPAEGFPRQCFAGASQDQLRVLSAKRCERAVG